MKITIETNNEVFSWQSDTHPNDRLLAFTVSDVAEKFKGLLVAAGYHPDCVDQVIDIDQPWFTDRGEEELLLNE
jgi:Tat protein secretion system quality control protein TatD with DNase activity